LHSSEEYPFLKTNPEYHENEIDSVYDNFDLLIMPAYSYESFGMVGLEALSRGIPVIATDKNGVKDILDSSESPIGMILRDDDYQIGETIKAICADRNILNQWNNNICVWDYDFSFDSHVSYIQQMYKRVISSL
jgi:glycosyltransferase involved in cell wall biosynthesis